MSTVIPDITLDNQKFPSTNLITVLEDGESEIIEGTSEDFAIPMGRTVIITTAFAISENFINSFFINKVLEKAGCSKRLKETVSWYDAAWFCNELSKLLGFDPVYEFTAIKKGRKKDCIIDSAQVTSDLTKNGFRLPTLAETDLAFKKLHITPHYRTWCTDCFTTVGSDETVFDPSGEESGSVRTVTQTNGMGKLKYEGVESTGGCFNFRICRNV